jgi:hypothetical protein
VVAGLGTSSVLLYDCLLWRALTEACTLERIDQRYGPPRLGMPGPALVASLREGSDRCLHLAGPTGHPVHDGLTRLVFAWFQRAANPAGSVPPEQDQGG